MSILSQEGKRTRMLAVSSAFLCAALMLSLAESILFPAGILPFPGAKPGLANAAILLCATTIGKRYSAAVSFSRVLLMFFLFGNGTSVLYSLSGATLSFLGILLFCNSQKISFLGKSVICAILHNTAQLICASFIIDLSMITLFPWMLITAVICGAFTGILLNFIYDPVYIHTKKFTRNT
ncbi:MAG: Gx transporter family protein [Ruminococcaceae bacterium]|nr:Gx transporter family protein [Oscillospiraceae bacterium]